MTESEVISVLITSRNNTIINNVSKLKMKKYRDELSLFVAEGEKLFAEAINSGLVPKYVFVSESSQDKYKSYTEEYNSYTVTREVYDKITNEKAPQGILGVFSSCDNIIYEDNQKSFNKINELFNSVSNGYIIIENMQDTGNVGTVIRTALAFGIDAVICVGCADLYNSKTLRAAMGALFKMKIAVCNDIKTAVELSRKKCKNIYAAALHKDSISIKEADFKSPCAVMIGNEGRGLSETAMSLCDKSVIIPISENSESLNAGVAAAIFMDYMRGR